MNYYFTFGQSDTQPYKGGWVRIVANTEQDARDMFKTRFGHTNYAFSYSEPHFKTTPMYKNGNFGQREHEVIDHTLPIFVVIHENKKYYYNSGAEVLIHHIGIIWKVSPIQDYISLVYKCYLSDNNETPLPALADYIAERYSAVSTDPHKELLEKFYKSMDNY